MGNLISGLGSTLNQGLTNLGNTVQEGANAVQGAVNGVERGVNEAASQVNNVAGQYIQDRGEHISDIGSKISDGHIVDAAMDAFQTFSLGSGVSDMAHAMGMVESPADRALLSGVVNAMTGNFTAAVGDGEDFLQNIQPRLQHTQRTVADIDLSLNANVNVEMAPAHFVATPRAQLQASARAQAHVSTRQSADPRSPRPAHGGYAAGRVSGHIDFGAIRARMVVSGRFEIGRPTHAGHGHRSDATRQSQGSGHAHQSRPNFVITRFAQDLPQLQRHFAQAAISNPQSRPAMPHQAGRSTGASAPATSTASSPRASSTAQTAGAQATNRQPPISNAAMSNMLSNPKLSFEDKMFLFMLAMAKNQEDKLTNLMSRYQAAHDAKNAKEQGGKTGKTASKTSASAGSTSQSHKASKAAAQSQAGKTKKPEAAAKPNIGTSSSGKVYPKGGNNDSMLGGIVDMIKGFDVGIVNFIGDAAPMAAPALGSAIGAALGTAIPIPIVGNIIGGAIGGMIGDMVAKEVIPQLCDQVATGIESGDFDWYFKGMMVMDANLLLPGLGTALAVEDSGAMGLLGPVGVAANELNKGETSAAQAAPKPKKSGKAERAASRAHARQAAKDSAKEAAHAHAREQAHAAQAQSAGNAGASTSSSAAPTSAATSAAQSPASAGHGEVPAGTESLNSESSDQQWTMQIQHAQEELSKMYTMLSNIMKSVNDTQMTAVRNMR